MKNLKIILSLAFLMIFSLSSNEIFAQGEGTDKQKEKMEKAKKGKADKMKKKIDAEVTDAEKGAQDAKGKSKEKGKEMKEKMKGKKDEHKQDHHGDKKLEEGNHKTDEAMDYHNGNDDDVNKKVKKEKKEKKENNGNAYGKNKGDLKGKEFGKARSEEARARLKAKKGMAKAKINLGKEKSTASSEKIVKAKAELAKQIKEGKISEEDASRKDMAIKKAEKVLSDLDSTIEKGKKKLGEEN